MNQLNTKDVREEVRRSYGAIAQSDSPGCGCGCGSSENVSAENISMGIGYTKDDVTSVPQGANMGLGCGNPQAISSLKPGETVLDLGSGGGFDSFLAARSVGETGRVIGVDMTPEMLTKARAGIHQTGFTNLEFRLGEIENLPVADSSVDVIISNCVINLSPDKGRVFREAYRVLKPGGRLAISDIVSATRFPQEVREDLKLYSGCVAGASPVDELESAIKESGFKEVSILTKGGKKIETRQWVTGSKASDYTVSATIKAVKG